MALSRSESQRPKIKKARLASSPASSNKKCKRSKTRLGLLDLPLEIRMMIYDFLRADRSPRLIRLRWWGLGKGSWQLDGSQKPGWITASDTLSILSWTCKTIHHEFQSLPYFKPRIQLNIHENNKYLSAMPERYLLRVPIRNTLTYLELVISPRDSAAKAFERFMRSIDNGKQLVYFELCMGYYWDYCFYDSRDNIMSFVAAWSAVQCPCRVRVRMPDLRDHLSRNSDKSLMRNNRLAFEAVEAYETKRVLPGHVQNSGEDKNGERANDEVKPE